MHLDSGWAADKGTAEYMRYAFFFNAVWFVIWSFLATGLIALIVWIGSRVAYNSLPDDSFKAEQGWQDRWYGIWRKRYEKWEARLLVCRRIFACFGFATLGAFLIALALSGGAPAAPSTGILLLLLAALLASQKN
jgi:hypothetical protein